MRTLTLHSISDLEPVHAGLQVEIFTSRPAEYHQLHKQPRTKPPAKTMCGQKSRFRFFFKKKKYGGLPVLGLGQRIHDTSFQRQEGRRRLPQSLVHQCRVVRWHDHVSMVFFERVTKELTTLAPWASCAETNHHETQHHARRSLTLSFPLSNGNFCSVRAGIHQVSFESSKLAVLNHGQGSQDSSDVKKKKVELSSMHQGNPCLHEKGSPRLLAKQQRRQRRKQQSYVNTSKGEVQLREFGL